MRRDQQGIQVVDRVIETGDGRAILVQEGGDPAGHAILVLHGTPNSRMLYRPHVVDAAERAIRLISYDRPGYGRSTAQSGRSIADCAADVRAIIDALDIDRLAVWGISGGGPHALACASMLPDRVVAAATLASTAPFGAQDLDWFAGVGQENVEGGELLLNDPAAARARLDRDRLELLSSPTSDARAVNPTVVSPIDAAALTEELAQYYDQRNRDGLAGGVDGWWDDSVALLSPWGFSLETIRVPVMVWHGRQDRMVSFAHGEWLVKHLPTAEAHLTDHDGHLTLFAARVPTVHAWLLRRF